MIILIFYVFHIHVTEYRDITIVYIDHIAVLVYFYSKIKRHFMMTLISLTWISSLYASIKIMSHLSATKRPVSSAVKNSEISTQHDIFKFTHVSFGIK